MAFLELKGVEKHFGPVRAIKGIDLAIEPGEFIVFVGPSGCGKSTLLRLIAGLEAIDAGSLHLDGRDITRLPSAQRDLAMVFQSYALYPHMTVFDNMSFALKLAGVDKATIAQKVGRAADILNLGAYLQRTPRELSGGQRQRVAIGRAIVRAPKVFLFDEPLSNLDAALRGQTRVEIHNLHRELGATTVYVTHDQVEAMTLADRVVVLRDGVIEQVGSPLALYDRPVNQFVAQFIGMPSMNIVAARALPAFSQLTGGRLPADGFLGVRPEGVHVQPAAGVTGDAGLPGRVDLIEALGADTLIYVAMQPAGGGAATNHAKDASAAHGTHHADVVFVARQNERTALRPGDAVRVQLDPAALHVFNPQGQALAA
jgi:multiple sugar transport system ATP-binding protein